MIGQHLRFLRGDVAKALLQRKTDASVPFSAAHQQQAFIGGVTHQRVLEVEAPLEAALLGKHNSRGNQLCQHVLQFVVVLGGNRFQQGKGELPADHRGNLGHFARAAETVEAGHQRVLQCRRHRIPTRRFYHTSGQLFDEQRHAIGLGDNRGDRVRRQSMRGSNARDHLHAFGTAEASERNQRGVWP